MPVNTFPTFELLLIDGKELSIKPIFADMIRAEHLARKTGLAAITNDSIEGSAVLIYCALIRTGGIPTNTDFTKFCDSIEALSSDAPKETDDEISA
ncbi:hypothetical protein [Psychromicrobium sp. YIM B11713]|uniref:hypothetical protein n=1 Tax=Psychromicrobium sp. YIM B11713 TaxID=3145233 RepID=UPI00374F0914